MSIRRAAARVLFVVIALCTVGPSFAATTDSAAQRIELHRLDGGSGEVAVTLGVPFAPGKLTDFCPLYSAGGAEASVSNATPK